MKHKEKLETLRLCELWLDLLTHAGEYARRYYLARALECSFGAQYTRACAVLKKSYRTKAGLDAAIQRDLDSFPVELLEILGAQVACGLPAFPDRIDYLNQIMMGLTIVDRHGKERRSYYRRQIQKILNASSKGEPAIALSLNQLENGFKINQQKLVERRAKKAA